MRAAAWATLAGVVVELGFLGWLYGLGHFFDESTSRMLMFGSIALPLAIAIPVYVWRRDAGGAKFLAVVAFLAGAAVHIVLAMKLTSPALAVSPARKAERGIVFRTASIHGHTIAAQGGGFGGPTAIVNGSASTLYLSAVVYGYGMQPESRGTPILPGTVLVVERKVDHVGPDDAPPEAVTTQGFSESRTWLTW